MSEKIDNLVQQLVEVVMAGGQSVQAMDFAAFDRDFPAYVFDQNGRRHRVRIHISFLDPNPEKFILDHTSQGENQTL